VSDERSQCDRHPEGLVSICATFNVDNSTARLDRERMQVARGLALRALDTSGAVA
jgi:hypothetical protein